MRLIDADDLDILGYLEKFPIYESDRVWNAAIKAVAEYVINRAPTIDRPTRSQFKRMAVQLGYEAVIHCRECKEHRLFNGRDMCAKNATILDGHEVGLRATRADFYCADGERRADE